MIADRPKYLLVTFKRDGSKALELPFATKKMAEKEKQWRERRFAGLGHLYKVERIEE